MSRLSRDDWARAALDAMSEFGLAGIAIEPLASRLGATKGSFYWHFSARDELVAAALDLWESRSTTAVIDRVEAAGGTPQDRLRCLLGLVFDPDALTSADVMLLSSAAEPGLRETVERVTKHRIDYIVRLLKQAGLSATVARRRAVLAYSAFVGHLQLRRHVPDLLSSMVGPSQRYADEILAALLHGTE